MSYADTLRSKGYEFREGQWWPPAVAARLPEPIAQSDSGLPLVSPSSNEKGCSPRYRVCIARRASRLMDADNFAGGCKALIDGLKEYTLIPDDDPATVEFTFRQDKVKTKAEQGTEIVIEEIP